MPDRLQLAMRALRVAERALAIIDRESEPTKSGFTPNHFQQSILKALAGRALRTDALANEAGDRRRLFTMQGLEGLKLHGLIKNHPKVGYYRPDAPPPDLESLIS